MLAPVSGRWTRILIFISLCLFAAVALYRLHSQHSTRWPKYFSPWQPVFAPDRATPTTTSPPSETAEVVEESSPTASAGRVYKTDADRPLHNRPFVAVKEAFPLAAQAKSSGDLPPIPPWNVAPHTHVPEKTPLFIGFTRNWALLEQTVVSFLTAGWPPEDIYVVENTGVMDANEKRQLGEQNPFYLDNHRLKDIYKVNVITTPSLQTFAQLQNLYLYEAIQNDWPQYFWAHMDILVQSSEDVEPYKSFYLKSVDALRQSRQEEASRSGTWALRFFAYDWVTLMNTAAMVELGGWDTMISYYTIDCDMYERMRMINMSTNTANAGPVYDSGEPLEDLAVLYRQGDTRGSKTWKELQEQGKEMTRWKNKGGERNRWQTQQRGGQGEPYYRDMDGFMEALEIQVQAGISVFRAKWGGAGCSLRNEGVEIGDQWMVVAPPTASEG